MTAWRLDLAHSCHIPADPMPVLPQVFDLWDLRTPRNVFTGNQRTAAQPGTIADQSVRFDAEYSIAAANLAGYDLSLGTFDFQVEVVYTVYVP